MKEIIKNTLILTAITLVSGILLGLVYDVTKEPIAQSKEKAKIEAYQTVMQDADTFEELNVEDVELGVPGCGVDAVVAAKSGNDVKGYVVTVTTSEGYGGNIQVSVGIASDGTVKGIELLSLKETAGLGMNATKDEFKGQYADKLVDTFVVTKSGAKTDEEIDAITSATVTSNAVTGAVNAAKNYFNSELGGSVNE